MENSQLLFLPILALPILHLLLVLSSERSFGFSVSGAFLCRLLLMENILPYEDEHLPSPPIAFPSHPLKEDEVSEPSPDAPAAPEKPRSCCQAAPGSQKDSRSRIRDFLPTCLQRGLQGGLRRSQPGVSVVAEQVEDPTSVDEDVGLVPGPTQRVKDAASP